MLKQKIFPYLAYTVLIIGFMVSLLFGYWINQSEDILEIKNAPVPATVVKDYPPNGVVVLDVDFCKKTNTPGEIKRSFVGTSTEILLPAENDRVEKVCRRSDIPHSIPPQAAPGTYHIHYEVSYKLNPIKDAVIIKFDSKEFEIK